MGLDASGESSHRRRNAIIFAAVVALWLLIDQLTKLWAETGPLSAPWSGIPPTLPLIPGVVQLMLVHNTGGAWGMFSDMTQLLGVLALIVCAAAVLYLFVLAPSSSPLATVGLSLVVAGGIGSAIDRFVRGYVVDLIDPTFIDFPVFNVADIGVTIGIVLFMASLIASSRRVEHGSPDQS